MCTFRNSHVLPISHKTNVSVCSSELLEKPRHTGVTGFCSDQLTITFLFSNYVDALRYAEDGNGNEQKHATRMLNYLVG